MVGDQKCSEEAKKLAPENTFLSFRNAESRGISLLATLNQRSIPHFGCRGRRNLYFRRWFRRSAPYEGVCPSRNSVLHQECSTWNKTDCSIISAGWHRRQVDPRG
jgi:hypothetical protein